MTLLNSYRLVAEWLKKIKRKKIKFYSNAHNLPISITEVPESEL